MIREIDVNYDKTREPCLDIIDANNYGYACKIVQVWKIMLSITTDKQVKYIGRYCEHIPPH
jgi:hypothetical protein